MQIMKLERELSKFVREWIDARWQKWSLNYDAISRDWRTNFINLNQVNTSIITMMPLLSILKSI